LKTLLIALFWIAFILAEVAGLISTILGPWNLVTLTIFPGLVIAIIYGLANLYNRTGHVITSMLINRPPKG